MKEKDIIDNLLTLVMIKTITPFASPDLLLPFPIGSISQEAAIHGLNQWSPFLLASCWIRPNGSSCRRWIRERRGTWEYLSPVLPPCYPEG